MAGSMPRPRKIRRRFTPMIICRSDVSVIPGWCASTRPGISRFSDVQLHIGVRCGACHRAALCADPVASPRNDGGRRGNMQTELNKVVAALGEFYARETFLFEKDTGERTLTHRLAVHLER